MFKLNQKVKLEWADGSPKLFGTIVGGPTLVEGQLLWPIRLAPEGFWSEDHMVYVRFLLAHADSIIDDTPRLVNREEVDAFLDRFAIS